MVMTQALVALALSASGVSGAPVATPPTVTPTSADTTVAGMPHSRERPSGASTQEGVATAEKTTYTYEIGYRGNIVANKKKFVAQVAKTYAAERGWRRADLAFERVPRKDASDFTVVLAAADQMTSFSSLCSPYYSCRVGRYVIINQLRWRHSVSHWPDSRRSYRKMVINHETGHWLGLGHRSCYRAGAKAPVMQQQSKSLDGCRANPWPKRLEIASAS